jgi:protein-tyrosine phosphatase
MKMTSKSHPLRIDSIRCGAGVIGMTFCPGKKGPSNYGGEWDRDLQADLKAIASWDASALACLMETHEFEVVEVSGLAESVRAAGIAWYHLPIPDVQVPRPDFERDWQVAGEELKARLNSGEKIVLHCRGGLGRTGMIAARLLIEFGAAPDTAIDLIRAARKGAIETPPQEAYVRSLQHRPLQAVANSPERSVPRGSTDTNDTTMDWFEALMGFREEGYDLTRSKLEVDGPYLRSRINGRSYGIGDLELVSLKALRERVATGDPVAGQLRFRNIVGNVRHMHQSPEFAGALFQVASQFNLLEMVSPEVTPDHGVTRYQHDPTQGPACAIAAGAGTVYRNYFVPVGNVHGQTRDRQLDGLAEVGAKLSGMLDRPVNELWTMRNGYALCSQDGLSTIGSLLAELSAEELDTLRASLSIGVQSGVEVTEGEREAPQWVSQAYCSALPVTYTPVAPHFWKPFALMVLEAAYEATLLAAVLNARRGASNVVLLTRLGGGAFGNDDSWIAAAMKRALSRLKDTDLDVRLVSFNAVPASMHTLEKEFN